MKLKYCAGAASIILHLYETNIFILVYIYTQAWSKKTALAEFVAVSKNSPKSHYEIFLSKLLLYTYFKWSKCKATFFHGTFFPVHFFPLYFRWKPVVFDITLLTMPENWPIFINHLQLINLAKKQKWKTNSICHRTHWVFLRSDHKCSMDCWGSETLWHVEFPTLIWHIYISNDSHSIHDIG